MSLHRESRQIRKLRTARRTQFRLRQAFDRIDWEVDVLYPELDAWLGRATLPEPPTDLDISIETDDVAVLPSKAIPHPPS